jgi:hypothetical protein
VNEHDRVPAIKFLHQLLKLRIAEETITHVTEEHDTVAVECVVCESSFRHGVTGCRKWDGGEVTESFGILAHELGAVVVADPRQIARQFRVAKIDSRRRNRQDRRFEFRNDPSFRAKPLATIPEKQCHRFLLLRCTARSRPDIWAGRDDGACQFAKGPYLLLSHQQNVFAKAK